MIKQHLKKTQQEPFYERFHPKHLMLYLLMGSSAILFFLLIVVSFFHINSNSLSISPYFLLSTVALLLSSRFTFRLSRLYDKEEIKGIRDSVLVLCVGGCMFIILQYLGWQDMQSDHMSLANSYFIVLASLHALHVVLLTMISARFFQKYLRMSYDPIHTMLILANPFEKMKIKMLTQAWHYLDAIWVMILLMLVIKNELF